MTLQRLNRIKISSFSRTNHYIYKPLQKNHKNNKKNLYFIYLIVKRNIIFLKYSRCRYQVVLILRNYFAAVTKPTVRLMEIYVVSQLFFFKLSKIFQNNTFISF